MRGISKASGRVCPVPYLEAESQRDVHARVSDTGAETHAQVNRALDPSSASGNLAAHHRMRQRPLLPHI